MTGQGRPVAVRDVIGAILAEHGVLGASERDRVEAVIRELLPESLQGQVSIVIAPGREVVLSAGRLVALRLEALVPALREAVAEVCEGSAPRVRVRRI